MKKSNSKTLKNKSPNRIYHTWDKWECYPAGFYENQVEGKTDDECKEAYRLFLSDLPRFRKALQGVLSQWPNSCEHYLTNETMNRIAWLGQASACYEMKIPSKYRSGYFLLSKEEQKSADLLALRYLNKWLRLHGRKRVDLEEAGIATQVNLY